VKATLQTNRRPPRTKGKISGEDDDDDFDSIMWSDNIFLQVKVLLLPDAQAAV